MCCGGQEDAKAGVPEFDPTLRHRLKGTPAISSRAGARSSPPKPARPFGAMQMKLPGKPNDAGLRMNSPAKAYNTTNPQFCQAGHDNPHPRIWKNTLVFSPKR